jgi:hypothetical protein
MSKKDIIPLNDYGEYHGYCKLYKWNSDRLAHEGLFVNDREHGLWIDYNTSGAEGIMTKWYYIT